MRERESERKTKNKKGRRKERKMNGNFVFVIMRNETIAVMDGTEFNFL